MCEPLERCARRDRARWRGGRLRASVQVGLATCLALLVAAPLARFASAQTIPGAAQTRPEAARARAESAQAPPTSSAPDSLIAHIDSLYGAVRTHHAELHRFDSARQAARRRIDVDTTAAGPFLIVERASVDVSRVAAAFEAAWSVYAPLVGSARHRIDGTIVTLRLPDSFFAPPAHPAFRFHPDAGGQGDFGSTADRIVRGALTRALPADVLAWLDGETLRLRGGTDWAYRDLATSGSYAARLCARGDVSACGDALGLTEPGADWGRWYTADQIRQLIALDPRAPRSVQVASATSLLEHACVDEGDDAACLEDMRARGGPRPPLSGTSRATLLQLALVRGGPGSWARLHDDARDVTGRLENAAGIPAAELLAEWRAAVERERPATHAGLARAGAWTLVWFAGLALLAMRSTRWRLG